MDENEVQTFDSDETPIINAPVRVKIKSNAQRNRHTEEKKIQRLAIERKRQRQQDQLLDQYMLFVRLTK